MKDLPDSSLGSVREMDGLDGTWDWALLSYTSA